nr:MAG TPA: Protein of unknown function (DUF1489) [Caudoviricetes sp.]
MNGFQYVFERLEAVFAFYWVIKGVFLESKMALE